MIEASREGMRVAASRGVVAIHDKDGWLGAFEVFERLLEAGELDVRVWQSFPWDRLDDLRGLGLRSGFGNDMLRMGYLKGFMDGTLGSATARLLDGSGVEISSREVLEDVVRRGAEAAGRWPCTRSATPPTAPRSTRSRPPATPGSRAACASGSSTPSCSTTPTCARFAELGVAASVQFSHAPSDRDLAERLWEGRQGAYAYRSLLDAGALLANGSDAPVEELDPLAGIVAGVLRTLDERPAWRPEQARDASRRRSTPPAWRPPGSSTPRTGAARLRPGMLADLVILNRDPFTCPPGGAAASCGWRRRWSAGRWTYLL